MFTRLNVFSYADENVAVVQPVRSPATPAEAEFLQSITATEMNLPVEAEIALSDRLNIKLILIPAGDFYMGSPSSESGRSFDEGHVHRVQISRPFYMANMKLHSFNIIRLLAFRKTVNLKAMAFR